MRVLVLSLIAVFVAPARGQAARLSDLPPLPEARPKIRADPDGLIRVAAGADWRGWLARHSPDRSSSWPAPAAESFALLAKEESWDYVGRGDFDRDGTPTALLLKFRPSKAPDAGVVDRLTIAKWRDGTWVKPVDLRAGKGASLNGAPYRDFEWEYGYLIDLVRENPKDAARPGLSFFLELANGRGQGYSDPTQVYFDAKTRRYAVSDE